MNKTTYSSAHLRKRKMMIVLPLLVLPFITMGFWALGGGKEKAGALQPDDIKKGLNLQLPDANLKKDNGLDKMSYYEMAAADSDKLKTSIRNDPYFKLSSNEVTDSLRLVNGTDSDEAMVEKNNNHLYASAYSKKQGTGNSETQVYDKLKAINEVLSHPTNVDQLKATQGSNAGLRSDDAGSIGATVNTKDVQRLESVTKQMQKDNSDTEMNQINAMLEKVMDIQHPERLNEKYKQYTDGSKKTVFIASANDASDTWFYGPSNEDSNRYSSRSFEAVVSDNQTLVNGAIIKFRLMSGININGILIPTNNFVFGKVALNEERLSVAINAVRYRNEILPVAMSVYDLDGIEGIYIPGAITRDVAKQSADNALQSVAMNTLDPSIGMQAAGVGIETAKTLISKKVKLVRVTVRAGYHVLLKNNDAK